MTLNSNGNLLVGTTTDNGSNLQINGSITAQNSDIFLGQDGTYSSGYRTLGFGGNSNGSNRIFGGVATNDGLFLCSKTGQGISLRSNGGAIDNLQVKSTGVINIANVPSSSVGLVTGDIYQTAGVLNIVP
jgi:hypothetical protein